MIRALVLFVCLVSASSAAAQCRQALALGLDVSGSVDSAEYRMQLQGLAAALQNADVRAALLSNPGAPVHLAVYEWSGSSFQRIIVEWTAITDASTLSRVVGKLAATTRTSAPPGTALGTAMQFGAGLLVQRENCWKRTLDISGDGKHNLGPHPRDIQAALTGAGLTLNALVIGADSPASGDLRQVEIGELSSYFRAWVIVGADAFVETAIGFRDYEAAMTRKLKRELQGLVVSSLPAR